MSAVERQQERALEFARALDWECNPEDRVMEILDTLASVGIVFAADIDGTATQAYVA